MADGSVRRFNANERTHYGINPENPYPEGGLGMYHTHWDRPGQTILITEDGSKPDITNIGQQVYTTTTARGHGAYDYQNFPTFVVNRYEVSYHMGYGIGTHTLYPPFFRYFPLFLF